MGLVDSGSFRDDTLGRFLFFRLSVSCFLVGCLVVLGGGVRVVTSGEKFRIVRRSTRLPRYLSMLRVRALTHSQQRLLPGRKH